jgi:endoglucanase
MCSLPLNQTLNPTFNTWKICVQADYLRERETERRAKRMVRVKLFPMLLYICFILASLLYVYVRVRHGMGGLTPPLVIYSYVVLFVEMLGALNMVFYGCWLFAKPVNTDVFPPPDPNTGKEAPFRRKYNVRVMIPCYKESLAIIQRTVLASKRADRPPGMKLVIYVCDDGNDDKKLAWVQRLNDPEV